MMAIEIGVILLYGLCLVFMLGFSPTQWQLTRLAGGQVPWQPRHPAVWPRVRVQLPVYK